MKYLFWIALFMQEAAFACWAPCDAGPGEECYFEQVWSPPAELEKMASGRRCYGEPEGISVSSTGSAYRESCIDGRIVVVQLAPNKVMKKRPVSEDPKGELDPTAYTPADNVMKKCEFGPDQEICLANQKEILENPLAQGIAAAQP